MAPRPRKLVKKHRPVKDGLFGRPECPLCRGRHTLDQHRFHGKGSFIKTHG